jgi:hypothetical protein
MMLPAAHYNAFIYLTSFLREVIASASDSAGYRGKCAMVFSSVLLRPPKPPPLEKYERIVAKKRQEFLKFFL